MKDKFKIIGAVILVVLVSFSTILPVVLKKEKNEEPKIEEIKEEIVKKKIIIEGMEEIVEYHKITTNDGDSFLYDPEYLTKKEIDAGFLLENPNNKDVYFKIERIKKEEFNSKENKITKDVIINYYYKSFNDNYYVITTSIPNDTEYQEGMGTRLMDMVNNVVLR